MRARTATLEPAPPLEVVKAAGGLVVRRTATGTEIALVHRPAREDWTFPKGKLEPGESFEDAARREVREETGYTCRLGRFLGHTEYQDRKERPKVVAYWLMEVLRGRFRPSEEVDELRWLPLPEAGSLLSYQRDRELLDALMAAEETAPAS